MSRCWDRFYNHHHPGYNVNPPALKCQSTLQSKHCYIHIIYIGSTLGTGNKGGITSNSKGFAMGEQLGKKPGPLDWLGLQEGYIGT